MKSKRDELYAQPAPKIADFVFDGEVASVFPDMIRRSVPGYATIIFMIGVLAKCHAQRGSFCYDLGCSLGAASLSMRRTIKQPGCRIIAVDNSPDMISRCSSNMHEEDTHIPVHLICADIRDVGITNASVVVLNFTLQFIDPDDRFKLIRTIYRGMLPGGILIVSEKITFSDPRLSELHIDMHHSFKRLQGYSELEISQKRSALERVLIPETVSVHKSRFREAGFECCDVWFQCFNFASMVAFK